MLHTETTMRAGYTLALSHGTFPNLRPVLKKKKGHILKMRGKTRVHTLLLKMSSLYVGGRDFRAFLKSCSVNFAYPAIHTLYRTFICIYASKIN